MITQIHPFDINVTEPVYYDLGFPDVIEEEIDRNQYMDGKFPENSLYIARLWRNQFFNTHKVWFTEARFLRYFIKKYMK